MRKKMTEYGHRTKIKQQQSCFLKLCLPKGNGGTYLSTVRGSIPRQVDKSWGPQGERGLEFSRMRKGQIPPYTASTPPTPPLLIKTIPMEKKCKKAKWLSGEALQIAVIRREAKSKGEKERYKHLNADYQRIARRDKKAFLSEQRNRGKQHNGKD